MSIISTVAHLLSGKETPREPKKYKVRKVYSESDEGSPEFSYLMFAGTREQLIRIYFDYAEKRNNGQLMLHRDDTEAAITKVSIKNVRQRDLQRICE